MPRKPSSKLEITENEKVLQDNIEVEKKATTAKKSTTKVATKKSSTKTTSKKSSTKKTTTKASTKSTKTSSKKTTTSKKGATKRGSSTARSSKKKTTVTEIVADEITPTTDLTKKIEVLEYYDLPYRYNQTVVKVLAQTPTTLFIYWDISDADRANFVEKYGENFFNNTKPVLVIRNKTMHYSFEIEIDDFANSWYLHVNDANCEYQVELGRRHKENPNYYYVTTSNNLDMPNNHILLENISNNVLFKNVKTQELVEKPITSITFFKDFAKSKDFYKYFKELLNNELEGDEINFNLPSSHTSSSFK